MSKKMTVGILVVLALAAGLYFWNKNKSDTTGTPGTSTSPKASPTATGNSVQGTGTVTYKCQANKSFALTFSDANTARLSGAGITGVTLKKTGVDYWLSSDGKTVVKPAGGYIVLVQNDQTTHDLCVKQ